MQNLTFYVCCANMSESYGYEVANLTWQSRGHVAFHSWFNDTPPELSPMHHLDTRMLIHPPTSGFA